MQNQDHNLLRKAIIAGDYHFLLKSPEIYYCYPLALEMASVAYLIGSMLIKEGIYAMDILDLS